MADINKVNNGDLMCFPYWGKVLSTSSDQIHVEGLDGKSFYVQGVELINKSFSADQFDIEKTVSKTTLAEIFTTSHNVPFTICFKKANGKERVLRGRYLRHEPLMGRSYVEDLDITSGSPLRQVDHRSIKYLVVHGVKYIAK